MPETNLQKNEKKETQNTFNAIGLAMQLGYLIALPLVLLSLAGRFLDQYFVTSPWFFIAGIIFSIFVSSYLVYFKAAGIISGMGNEKQKTSAIAEQASDNEQEIKK